MNRPYLLPVIATLIAGSGATGSMLAAAETPFVGPAATAMGGSSVAIADDALAQYHNPAFFGFMGRTPDTPVAPEGENGTAPEHARADRRDLGDRRFSLNYVDVNMGGQLLGNLGTLVSQLNDINTDALENASSLTAQDIKDITTLAASLSSIDDPGNLALLDANAGASIQIGSIGVGLRSFGMAQAYVDDVDLQNLGLDFANGAALGNEIASTAASDPGYTPGSLQVLSNDQATELGGSLGGNAAAVQYIDHQLQQGLADGTITPDQIDETIATLTAIGNATGTGGSLDQNTTLLVASGIGLFEIPVSYGYAFNDNLSIGITGKLLMGRVYGGAARVFDDDFEDAFSDITDNSKETTTATFDLGVAYRVGQFQLGARGTNLTKPEFDGPQVSVDSNGNGTIEPGEQFTVDTITLDPQLTIGGAWIPWSNLVLTLEGDLLEASTVSEFYDTRYIRGGLEWDALDVLALRGGAYMNTANSDAPLVITGGVGLDLYLLQVDLAAAVSPGDTAEFDGDEYPEVFRVSLGVKSVF
ncbi:MAG: conjugal transfer protein TraF [Planctomycetota bacterium]|jgi:hypothetical protein|nr:conjugal transfer protein TraF [Planctomycetota bacterium]